MMALVDICNSSLLHTLTMRVRETGGKGDDQKGGGVILNKLAGLHSLSSPF